MQFFLSLRTEFRVILSNVHGSRRTSSGFEVLPNSERNFIIYLWKSLFSPGSFQCLSFTWISIDPYAKRLSTRYPRRLMGQIKKKSIPAFIHARAVNNVQTIKSNFNTNCVKSTAHAGTGTKRRFIPCSLICINGVYSILKLDGIYYGTRLARYKTRAAIPDPTESYVVRKKK